MTPIYHDSCFRDSSSEAPDVFRWTLKSDPKIKNLDKVAALSSKASCGRRQLSVT